jgi:hypothetical protein
MIQNVPDVSVASVLPTPERDVDIVIETGRFLISRREGCHLRTLYVDQAPQGMTQFCE